MGGYLPPHRDRHTVVASATLATTANYPRSRRDRGEKKHDASPHRRQQAREKGQVARSQDMGSALVLLLAVLSLRWFGPQISQTIATLMKAGFTQVRYWNSDPRAASGLVATGLGSDAGIVDLAQTLAFMHSAETLPMTD